MVADASGNFIIQHVAGSDLFSEVVAYEQVIILERMFAVRAENSLLLNIMKLPMTIKENTL